MLEKVSSSLSPSLSPLPSSFLGIITEKKEKGRKWRWARGRPIAMHAAGCRLPHRMGEWAGQGQASAWTAAAAAVAAA